MDWYLENDVEDLAVPQDEEMFDRLTSPDSWSSWSDTVGNSPKKLYVSGLEELLLSENMFSGTVELLNPPRSFQSSRCTFGQHARHDEHSDALLNDLSTIDEADDIFLYNYSLFEVDARALEEADRSANCTETSSQDDVMETVADLFGGRNHDRESIDDVENASHFLSEKEPNVGIFGLEEQSRAFEDICEEDISMEETALLDLQRLTVQLANKTRICFRDSLYRLAENSRSQTKCDQDGIEDLENDEPTTTFKSSRLQESEAKNSDTNAIDRTVATLLFDTMRFCHPTAASTSGLNAETPHQSNSRVSSVCTVPGNDAEVPTLYMTDQTLSSPRLHNAPFLTTPPMWS